MNTSIAAAAEHRPSRALHLTLWGVQVLLAALFLMAGVMKTTLPIADLAAKGLQWAVELPTWLVRFIGASELAGALGLLLPSLTRIRPGLTALAAAGLSVVMGLALLFHLSRGEASAVGMNLALGGLAAFVAWGRFRKAPIRLRQ